MTDFGLSPSDLTAERILNLTRQELSGTLGKITIPQSKMCEVTFVVPVFDESPQRVERLVKSLGAQTAFRHIEVILVVNNKPDDGSQEWQAAFQRNQTVLNLPFIRNRMSGARVMSGGFSVYAIDTSSHGRCPQGSNVGMARQRGLLEATRRFAQRGVNGVIIHTDVDCWFEDPTFVERTLWLMKYSPNLVGFAGNCSLELQTDETETKGLAEVLEQYLMFRNYGYLYSRITRGHVRYEPNKALGSCIVHRAFEGMAVGGFQSINLAEDVYFGRKLTEYATQHGLRFDHGRKWNLGPMSAMRISVRTDNSSLSKYLARIDSQDIILVDDAFNPGNEIVLDRAYMDRLITAVLSFEDGEALLEWLFVISAQARLRVVGA
ncbi:MAG TPA: glycosyltransferase family 2 protein [Magnetospirillaceae bacterium]|nr:glycosyltransferase family 2 protein [Magnetospirillaceae bacterium]